MLLWPRVQLRNKKKKTGTMLSSALPTLSCTCAFPWFFCACSIVSFDDSRRWWWPLYIDLQCLSSIRPDQAATTFPLVVVLHHHSLLASHLQGLLRSLLCRQDGPCICKPTSLGSLLHLSAVPPWPASCLSRSACRALARDSSVRCVGFGTPNQLTSLASVSSHDCDIPT